MRHPVGTITLTPPPGASLRGIPPNGVVLYSRDGWEFVVAERWWWRLLRWAGRVTGAWRPAVVRLRIVGR